MSEDPEVENTRPFILWAKHLCLEQLQLKSNQSREKPTDKRGMAKIVHKEFSPWPDDLIQESHHSGPSWKVIE
ncbi:hypothetical protein AnigIFM60653_000463 [Aspergillus niger]|nr:hypothetical protein AnigIFM50267_005824 [Aspergillus niger]GKZ77280.1 hypothetical protein AnigIFM56816_010082 [Aspergillus niger]GLA01529.1 hypothetical protein AnigIFM60653_000463 [Aspergillus niger]GLA34737.1 hypothetical protein AnigIFM63309_008149 [Aspergillus niger]